MLLATKIKHAIKLLEEIEEEGALRIYDHTDIPETSSNNEMEVDELNQGYLYGGDWLEIHLSKKSKP
jgi:hypothetical protein